ncbi:MAG: tyrosine-protein phosphatase [Chthoniobacteraceae bacterium]
MLRLFTALILLTSAAQAERPAKWAQPVQGATVKNLNRVTPQLFRSAQPDAAGMREIEKLGVRTVIDLRDLNDDQDEARGTKLRLLSVPMNTWHIEDEDVVRVLTLLRRRKNGPFLVHCHHGSDRTGVVCAMFRIVEQGWSREDAIRELRDGGFGFHKAWVNIPRYLGKVDIEKIRRGVDSAAK